MGSPRTTAPFLGRLLTTHGTVLGGSLAQYDLSTRHTLRSWADPCPAVCKDSRAPPQCSFAVLRLSHI